MWNHYNRCEIIIIDVKSLYKCEIIIIDVKSLYKCEIII